MPKIVEDSAIGSLPQSSGQTAALSSGPPSGVSSERSSSRKKTIPYLRRSGQAVYVFLDADGQIANDHRNRFADLKDILQRNVEKCRKLYDCLADISYELRVCGTDESSASPAIVITCPAHKAKHLRTIIAQPHVQDQCRPDRNSPVNPYPELQIMIWAEPILRKSFGVEKSGDMDVGVAPLSPRTLCGVQVIYDRHECRKSTVACLVSVQNRRFALTTAHALRHSSILPVLAEDSSIESMSDKEVDPLVDEDLYDFPEDETLGLIPEDTWARPEIIARGHAIYQAPTDEKWTNSHPDLDWLLLELKNPSQWLPNIWSAPDLGSPISLSSVSSHAPSQNRHVFIISSRGPAINGIIRPIPSYIGGTWSSLTSEVWTVELADADGKKSDPVSWQNSLIETVIRRGDSGSLVIDASDHKVYGQVIATSPLQDVYVVPLRDILHQIEEFFQEGNASLQATHAQSEDDFTSNAESQPSSNTENISIRAACAPLLQNAGQTLETPNDSTWIVSELQCLVHSMTEALEHQDLHKVSEILKTSGQERIVTEFQSLVHSTAQAQERDDLQSAGHIPVAASQQFDHTRTAPKCQSMTLVTPQHDNEDLQKFDQAQFPVLSVPIAENRDFTGRQKELDTLEEKLILNHRSAGIVSCALNGTAGIGKTQTALKFLYKQLKKFDAIFWVSADPEQKSEIDRTFCNIGLKLKLFKGDRTDDAQIEAVYTWLQTTGSHFFYGLSHISGLANVRYRATMAIDSRQREGIQKYRTVLATDQSCTKCDHLNLKKPHRLGYPYDRCRTPRQY